jgi:hypothetical protein
MRLRADGGQDVKRVGRYILSGLTAVSLLLCIATVGLWARSFWINDMLTLMTSRHTLALYSGRGRLLFYADRNDDTGGYRTARAGLTWRSSERGYVVEAYRLAGIDVTIRCGFSTAKGQWHGSQWWEATAPCWFIALVGAGLPTWSIRARRARRRPSPGCCRRCGYDLRATPNRCPECGTPVPAKAPA